MIAKVSSFMDRKLTNFDLELLPRRSSLICLEYGGRIRNAIIRTENWLCRTPCTLLYGGLFSVVIYPHYILGNYFDEQTGAQYWSNAMSYPESRGRETHTIITFIYKFLELKSITHFKSCFPWDSFSIGSRTDLLKIMFFCIKQ